MPHRPDLKAVERFNSACYATLHPCCLQINTKNATSMEDVTPARRGVVAVAPELTQHPTHTQCPTRCRHSYVNSPWLNIADRNRLLLDEFSIAQSLSAASSFFFFFFSFFVVFLGISFMSPLDLLNSTAVK